LKALFLVSTALGALISTTALASDGATEVDILVITANRTPENIDHVGGQITVIDAARIRAMQTPVVSDILLATPGVSLSRNGGVGTATQLKIRGAETGQTVVLIDGVKLNDPSATDSGYNFGNLLVGDVERIEVLRGPQSVLWGSQAIGGVVDIITRDPAAPFETTIDVEGGSFGTAYGRLGVGGKSERVSWRAAGAYLTSDGISAFDKSRGGRERDGYRNLGGVAKAKVTLTDQLSLDVRGVYSRGRAEVDGFQTVSPFGLTDTPEYGTTREWIGYAGLNLDLLEGRFSNRLAIAYTDTARNNYNPAQAVTTRTFDAAGRNRRFEYQGTLKLAPTWTAVFGAESERSSFRTASPSSATPNPVPGRRSASLDGVYAQLSGQVIPDVTLTGGLRYDDQGDFGGHTVGHASVAWKATDSTVLRASVGQGFKAPSLFQLGSDFGNAALDPEEATSWDAGVEQRFLDGRVTLSGAYFERHTKNQIDFVSCFGAPSAGLCLGAGGLARTGYYGNIARSKAHGLEFAGTARPTDALTLTANYSYTVSLNDVAGNANFGKWLARRPRNQANLEVSYMWPFKLTTAVAARYSGHSFDDAANRNLLKTYTLWDVRASYPVTDQIEVYGRIENLFDKSYETIRNYGQLGRAAYAGVRARF
jgi:vitamin B12 transporter